MTTSSRLEIASATDPGVVRSFNEDSIAIDNDLQLLVLADGMGGYKAGDVASAMATGLIVDDIKRKLGIASAHHLAKPEQVSPESVVIKAAIEKANRAIFKTAEANNKYHGMGTTVVVALFHNNRVTIAHAGDSRLYRLRHGRFELLTHDHSLLQEQVEMGLISSEEAKVSHNRNLVTRALGVESEIKVDLTEKNVLPGDVYLLCSDGLNDMVDDTDIELAVSELQSNLSLAANQLVQMANDNGGHDNVSVLIAKVVNETDEERSFSERLFGWLKKF